MSNKDILSQDDNLQNSSLPKKTNLLKKPKKTGVLEKQKKKSLCSSPLISDFDEENDENTFLSSDDDSEESVGYSHSEGFGKVKLLPPSVLKDIEQKNLARKLAGLAPILVRVRRCLACGSSFQSSGNRTCGCASRSAGTIAGREII